MNAFAGQIESSFRMNDITQISGLKHSDHNFEVVGEFFKFQTRGQVGQYTMIIFEHRWATVQKAWGGGGTVLDISLSHSELYSFYCLSGSLKFTYIY